MPSVETLLGMNYRAFVDYVTENEKHTRISDGVYDVTDIDFIQIKFKDRAPTIAWIEAHDKFWVANAYETDTIILFAEEPKKFEGGWKGSGFSYGSTNVLTNCPKTLLILAEND